MDDLGDLNTFDRIQLAKFPSSHHGSALTFYPQRHVIGLMNGVPGTPRSRLIEDLCEGINQIDELLGTGYDVTDDPKAVYSFLLSSSISRRVPSPQDSNYLEDLKLYIKLALMDTRNELNAIQRSHPAFTAPLTIFDMTDASIDTLARSVFPAFWIKRLLEQARNAVQLNHVNRDMNFRRVFQCDGWECFVVRDLVVFSSTLPGKTLYLLNYDQLLMMMDTVSCRFMTRLALELNSKIGDESLPDWSLIRRVYAWGDQLISDFGIEAYSVIGEFESIVTGVLVTFRDSDPLGLGAGFIQSLIETATETEAKYRIPRTRTLELLHLLKEIGSVNWLSEIFGLRKHWGNPMVDARASGIAVQEKISEELPVKGTALTKLLASFVRMITLSFIQQHGKWPKGHFLPDTPDCPLKTAFTTGNPKVPETAVGHKHEHWAYFQFECNCVLDSYKDDLAMISDKSVSLYRSHMDHAYVKKMCHVPLGETPAEDRRLILEYIRRDQLSILDIFKIVMTDQIPMEWLANTSSMKGTEMKHWKARIFAVLTYELRQYFAVTEDILKKMLFRYNPHQTMTLTEADLLSKLRNITRQLDPQSSERILCVMHIIDFSKWNLRMRYINTCLIFKAIDDFLGTPNLVEQSHGIFSDMLNIIADAFNPPMHGVQNTESETIWRNHNCGWEGQRQKGWTILTSAVLSDLARTTGIQSEICGQGDNQTLLSKFPVPTSYRNPAEWIERDPEGVRAVLDKFYKTLEVECEAIGLKIKTAETCRSLCYFNYGKRLYFNGVELSMTLKRLAKNITEPNDSYPNSEGLLKTLEGTAFAAGLYSHPGIVPYVAGRVATIMTLDNCFTRNQLITDHGRSVMIRKGLVYSARALFILLQIPSSLGGIPQLQLSSYLYRGHPDPLTVDLVMLSLKAKAGCDISRRIIQIALSGEWFNRAEINRDSLIESPYSLNLSIPTSCKTPIEKEIMPAMRQRCGNSQIKDMFSVEVEQDERSLLDILGSMTPFQPLIANDIFSRSVPGRRKAFISGLANTTSLGRLIMDSPVNPMVERIKRLERLQIESWVDKIQDVANLIPARYVHRPHHELAQQLREMSWQVEMQGVTVPHPLEQLVICETAYDLCSGACHLAEREHIAIVRHSENLIKLRSEDESNIRMVRSKKGSPYLGSRITEGMIQQQAICHNPDDTWRDVIRLNTVGRWVCGADSNLRHVINQIIASRTDVDDSIIDAATGMPSRLSYNHRAHLMKVIPECHISTTSNMHSRLYISSNRMGEYSHGTVNYHLPYGPSFLCIQSLLVLSGSFDPTRWDSPRVNYHAHVRAPDVPVVYDGNVEVTTGVNMRGLVRAPKVIFTTADSLEFDERIGGRGDPFWNDISRASTRECRWGYAHQLISDSFVREAIIRETMTHIEISDFSSRVAPISIGDVSAVGLNDLVHSLAWNFVLLAPKGLYRSQHRDGFLVSAHSFLETFSSAFWDTFTAPLSNTRLLQQLSYQTPYSRTHNASLSNVGCMPMLRSAICTAMWTLVVTIRTSVNNVSGNMPYPIYASSASAVRLLFSKYVEMAVYIRLVSEVSISQTVGYSTDMAHNVMATPLHTLPHIRMVISHYYRSLQRTLGLEEYDLPLPKFYSLQLPWVDRVRILCPDPIPHRPAPTYQYPDLYPDVLGIEAILVTDQATLIPFPSCDCYPYERVINHHSECYFGWSGLLSKSHLKFLDIIFSMRLDVEGVIVLGSSTGSEAHAMSRIAQCRRVYVNCHLPLTSISPHMAGSYRPAMFSDGTSVDKLIYPDRAAMAPNDLTDPRTIETIAAHTESGAFSGITCDAEIPDETDMAVFESIVSNILGLVARRGDVKWLIVKVPYGCNHDIKRIMALISTWFGSIRPVWSIYTRPRSRLIHIVGSNRRLHAIEGISRELVPAVLASDESVPQACREYMMKNYPLAIDLSKAAMRSKKCLHKFAEISLLTACHRLIPGWSMTIQGHPTRESVKDSLKEVCDALHKHAKVKLRIAYRTHAGMQMPRNSILHIGESSLSSQLNIIYTRICLAELVVLLLDQDVFSFNRTEEIIDEWLNTTWRYDISTERSFTVELDKTRFINVSTRYIYEILGHVYRHKYLLTYNYPEQRVYHKLSQDPPAIGVGGLLDPLPRIDQHHGPVLTWKWARRSEVLSWLLSLYLVEGDLYVWSPHSFLIGELNVARLHPYIPGHNIPEESRLFAWIETIEDMRTLIRYRLDPEAVVVKVSLLPLLLERGDHYDMLKVPWSGYNPEVVMLRDGESIDEGQYPDFSHLQNTIWPHGREFLGCQCWDCAAEQLLTSHFKVSHSLIDRICSLGRIESVLDPKHAL